MFTLATLVVVACGLLCGACSGDEGLARYEHAIVAGAAELGIPAVGALSSGTKRMHCSGTLIAPKRVLTAAHCLDPIALDVVFGERRYSVRKKHLHPGYAPGAPGHLSFSFDIAVVELAEAVEGIEPLPLAVSPPKVGESITIVGLGLTQAGAGDEGQKRSATTTINRVTHHVFWLGAAHATPPTTCNGDSGGPSLVRRDGVLQILGVHSATEDAPTSCLGVGFDVRVDAFAAWIAAPDQRLPRLPAGDPCASHGDCAEGLRCAPAPHFVCARPCSELGQACPGSERCLELPLSGASGGETLCLPDSAGSHSVGQRCDSEGLCRQGSACLNTRDHGPRCSAFCDEASDTCPNETRCDDTMYSFAKVCLPEASWTPPTPAAPAQRADFGEACVSDGACAAGLRCRELEERASTTPWREDAPRRCTRPCSDASSCPAGHRCSALGSRRLCIVDDEGGCKLASHGPAGQGTPGAPTVFFVLIALTCLRLHTLSRLRNPSRWSRQQRGTRP